MRSTLIKSATLINEGQMNQQDLLIRSGRIEKIGTNIDVSADREIDATGLWLLPGIIDDQVHFREPGLTYKASIGSESKAAVAGGVTSFMEMPNTKPPALTQSLLEDKYQIAARDSWANYSFFMGASNDNIEEVLKTDPRRVCGVKVFMGSSTGNMLVDDSQVLEGLFREVPMLIATHCEDEATIRFNLEKLKRVYGDKLSAKHHPEIRSAEGCLLSSGLAVKLARKYNTRLHILHISTEDELALFDNQLPLAEKRITAEVCVHHLFFDASDYETLGNQIKCNPAIKASENKLALFDALLEDRLDIIATDHAPHTWEEKNQPYLDAPSGLPLVQHGLNLMLEFYQKGKITPEKIVEKMCHAPAECFRLQERGYLREGYWADLILVDPAETWKVTKENLYYKCGWSPLEGYQFTGSVKQTFVNGDLVYDQQHGFSRGTVRRLEFKG
ncbi:MAG: dihydroorotase [Saprospiraceae bacterium]|nr:dihydroorotase [Saprospiraceae bacterium]